MSNNPCIDLVAPGVADLHPYVPGKPLSELERELGIRDSIKLTSNENPLGATSGALEDREFLERSVVLNREGMAQLAGGFHRLGLTYIPSVGNFITVDLGRPGPQVDRALLREGCIPRPVPNYGLPNHLRVSIGLEDENRRFLIALKKVLQP